MRRPHEPRTRLESDIVEAEEAVQDFAARNGDVTVTTLRFCNGLGPDLRHGTPRCSRCPPCPASSASTRATSSSTRTTSSARSHHAVLNDLPASTTSRPTVCSRCRRSPACSASRSRRCCRPWGPGSPPRQATLGIRIPDEVRQQLRYGRGLDNRRFKQSGYRFTLTTREAVQAFATALRLKPLRESGEAPYRYEREVEEFLRWSPSVRCEESGS